MTIASSDERFRHGAEAYAAYLQTPEGRWRVDLAFANLQDFLPIPQGTRPLCALDIGCGTAVSGLSLARLGFHVTLLDSSQPMLDLARRAASIAGISDGVDFRLGEAAQLSAMFPDLSFDVVLCHNVLEYLDDPASVLRAAARTLRDDSAMLSIVVRNQAGEVVKAAIQAGDLAAAEENLTAEWGVESLYGGAVRLFTPAELNAMLNTSSLSLVAQRGIRVLSDYLPASISRSSEYARILDLEKKLGSRPEFAAVARYTQCLARRGRLEATQL